MDGQQQKSLSIADPPFHPHNSKNQISQASRMVGNISTLGIQSVTEARKLREQKENEVKKLHTRIAMLQAEEERALKRIDETRTKAQQILDFKIEQDSIMQKRHEQQQNHLKLARNVVQDQRALKETGRKKIEDHKEIKKLHAHSIKEESRKLSKVRGKNERLYIMKA